MLVNMKHICNKRLTKLIRHKVGDSLFGRHTLTVLLPSHRFTVRLQLPLVFPHQNKDFQCS